MSFALAVPVISAVAVAGVEFSNMTSVRSKLQAAADTAALSSARELRFANANASVITKVADDYARNAMVSLIGDSTGSVGSNVDRTKGTVEVTISRPYKPVVAPGMFGVPDVINVQATGRIGGGAPVCVLGLDPVLPLAIMLDANARLTAPDCVVYANSRSFSSLATLRNGVITAKVICTVGGKIGRAASFLPDVITGCPQIQDPLASRAPPPVSALCKATDLVVSATNTTLQPGTYCGGLKITAGSNVRLDPGVYIIKDGPLVVDGGSSLTGNYTGFYLTGAKAVVNFADSSIISIVAPKDGPLASFLFFEDRNAPILRLHRITSNDARVMLGTIYLPRGILHVDADKPVADRSAYTIIVARHLHLAAGPNLVMNANYANTDVPVPQGMGVVGQTSQLIK
ncbi:MAG: TadE/TadG family type IV pilus assembly protein [Alphaproteobacteria bacterium]